MMISQLLLSGLWGRWRAIPIFYHQGSGLGYVAEVRIYPKENIGSVILMNRSEYDALLMLNVLDSEFVSHSTKNVIITQ